MTGLYNRRFFEMRLEDEVSRYCRFNHSLSVVMIDVDGFTAINDELGHGAGDDTLRAVGALLIRHSRNIDVIARYGGDEFAVVLMETPKSAAVVYAERIRRQIESAAFRHGRAVTVSIGVACLPEDVGPVPEDIVTTAEWALEEARRSGRNTVAEREGLVAKRRGGWDL
jgi:diguanylate cyclase (GGDEF)-like protein